MSAIQAISAMRYIAMRNNASLGMMQAHNAQLGLISGIGENNISFGSLDGLNAMDTQLELSLITNSLQYKMAKAMLEQIEKQRKEDSKRFNVFA